MLASFLRGSHSICLRSRSVRLALSNDGGELTLYVDMYGVKKFESPQVSRLNVSGCHRAGIRSAKGMLSVLDRGLKQLRRGRELEGWCLPEESSGDAWKRRCRAIVKEVEVRTLVALYWCEFPHYTKSQFLSSVETFGGRSIT